MGQTFQRLAKGTKGKLLEIRYRCGRSILGQDSGHFGNLKHMGSPWSFMFIRSKVKVLVSRDVNASLGITSSVHKSGLGAGNSFQPPARSERLHGVS